MAYKDYLNPRNPAEAVSVLKRELADNTCTVLELIENWLLTNCDSGLEQHVDEALSLEAECLVLDFKRPAYAMAFLDVFGGSLVPVWDAPAVA
ncbi:hypothetical protein K7H13_13650 [Qipengyuania citrea]|uniref:hypothetical protein n=1 Tax=Qipengyuania citrea TaxID=225971 RepID=UPI001E36A485|nr:hypothetical protein [Qipengyuania citrea]MCD1591793.1 hypothetical protein [Qipengyuania citrea]